MALNRSFGRRSGGGWRKIDGLLGKESVEMPILGIGTDIVETERVREMCERDSAFCRRVFTRTELDYSEGKITKYQHLAARFSAKEAVAKALGGSFSWQDVEVVNNSAGKPMVNLYGRAKEAAGSARVHLSVSHTRGYACAMAVVEGEE